MIKKLLFIPLLAAGSFCIAQSSAQVQLPQVIPASPEASAIAKSGQLSVGLFTGVPQVTIPLYEINVRGLTVPVGVSYISNGTKVDEIPSRTGLGWVMSAGGAISRSVHGRPDDKSIRTPMPTGTVLETQWRDYYESLSAPSGNADNEPDEFMLNAPGLSARFILDKFNQPVFLTHSNFKVQFTGGTNGIDPYSEFIVTNTGGIKYFFGGSGAIETTVSHNMLGKYLNHQQIRTAFFLKKIEFPGGDNITYNYSPVTFMTHPGITQSVSRGNLSNNSQSCLNFGCSGGGSCPAGEMVDPGSFNEHIAEVQYNTVSLTQITGPNGLSVSFGYENRPDGSNDKRLISINIQAPQFSKLYRFIYADPPTNGVCGYSTSEGTYNKRFFLTEIQSIKPAQGSVPADTIRYILDYEDMNNLPPRLCFSQDYLGFYNGVHNFKLLPFLPGESQYWGVYATADRSFHGDMAVKGMLKKVTYPTGGYEEFVYEPNTVVQTQSGGTNVMVTKSISGSGNSNPSNPSGTWINVDHYSDTLLVLKDQAATITLSIFENPGCPECTPAPPNTVDIAWLDVINVTTNTVVWTELMRTYTTTTFPVQLYANNIYKLKLRVRGLPNAGYAEIRYDRAPIGYSGYSWSNVEAGGVRVKQIIAYDPVSQKTNNKYYTYSALADPLKSSGKSQLTADLVEEYNYRKGCSGSPCPPGTFYQCQFRRLTSNSAVPLYVFDNNHIGYEYVVEADDPYKINGATEHKYDATPSGTIGNAYLGFAIKTLPNSTGPTTGGAEIRTRHINNNGTLIKEITNTYAVQPGHLQQVEALAVRKRYGSDYYYNTQAGELIHPFDATQYDFKSYWITLQSTQTNEYDPAGNTTVSTTINYFYGTPNNIQPARVETINSEGQTTSFEMKYPTDYPGISPYSSMVTNNVISPVIEHKGRNVSLNKELSKIITNYQGLQSNSIFKPLNIQRSLLAQQLETEATFDLYDAKGNLLQLTAKDGVPTSYIWSYNGLYPVAKIIGKTYNDAISQSGINLSLFDSIPVDAIAQTELNKLRQLTGALISTYMYIPHTGIAMETDPRGRNTTYTYDNIGRLILVKDHDGNVLKKICYNYAGHAENCSSGGCTNTTPYWQNTATPLRCQQNGSGQNTGYQEQEQKDMNVCSPTSNQTRWLQTAYNPTACTPVVNVSITCTNYLSASGFSAVYTHNTTGQVTTFSIPSSGGLQTLGTLPSGTYTLTISKPGNNMYLIFGSGCNGQTVEGLSATFYNVAVSASACNSIFIDAAF